MFVRKVFFFAFYLLLTAKFVKNRHIYAGIFFISFEKHPKTNLKLL